MNSMSLLRNSVIVGGATFLVGSAFMQISKADSKSDIGKWPYIATFLSGALGFYLLKQQFVPVPEALELNADTYISKKMRKHHFGKTDEELLDELHKSWLNNNDELYYEEMDEPIRDDDLDFEEWVELHSKFVPRYKSLGEKKTVPLPVGMHPFPTVLNKNAEALELNAERIHGDERLDRWVENHYGDEYDWLLLEDSSSFEDYDPYDILEDFIVLDDDGNEHKGLIIIHREEYDAEYDLQNTAIHTVIADNENEALSYIIGADRNDPDQWPEEEWEIVDIREAEELQSFSAEVFEADRKIRRRTRWTWTRGPEDGFEDKDTVPYSNYYNQTSYKGRGWNSYSVPKYLIEDSYHINDLPEGYHLHLLKPNLRKDKWVALAKSPSSDDWRSFSTTNKSDITQNLLAWYNDDIAKPEVAELSPIDKLMIQSGMASGDVQISRIETKGYKGDEYNKIQWFASGGPDRLPVVELATALGSEGAGYSDGAISVRIGSSQAQRYGVLPFVQGLLFMGLSAGTNRSVNRYNKDSAKWVKSYPAWFQNAVKNQIETLWFGLEPQGNYQPRYKICNQDVVLFDPEGSEGKIETMGGKMRGFRVRIPTSDTTTSETYYRPRPSTQRKLYEASFKMGLDGKWNFNAADLFMAICDKFKFEDLDSIQTQMLADRLALNRTFRDEDETLQNVGKLMLRRFKKK